MPGLSSGPKFRHLSQTPPGNFLGCEKLKCAVKTGTRNSFYPRGASDARVIAIIVCLCVCLSVCVCVSHTGIVSKRLNVGSRKQHRVIA